LASISIERYDTNVDVFSMTGTCAGSSVMSHALCFDHQKRDDELMFSSSSLWVSSATGGLQDSFEFGIQFPTDPRYSLIVELTKQ
jgi:hypothetical protein